MGGADSGTEMSTAGPACAWAIRPAMCSRAGVMWRSHGKDPAARLDGQRDTGERAGDGDRVRRRGRGLADRERGRERVEGLRALLAARDALAVHADVGAGGGVERVGAVAAVEGVVARGGADRVVA